MIRPSSFLGTHPLGPEQFLARPRIHHLLSECMKKQVSIVVAGAGYGKTQAVISVLEADQYHYAWMQLSELDNSIAIMWERLTDAIGGLNRELSEQLKTLGYPDAPASFYQFLRLIEGEAKRKRHTVMVFDDFHVISDDFVLHFFEKVIAANVENLSVVLVSREMPKIPLAGMLSKGLLGRITEEDLRFTQDEMEAYFQLQGKTLSAGVRSELYAYSEGWALAIYLVGLSMNRIGTYGQGFINQAKIDIFALIEDEIYAGASRDLRKFLVKVAMLDAMPMNLLKEFAEDSPEVVGEMIQSNRLIRYDPRSDCFRMHRIFRDFLLTKQSMLTREEIYHTHRTAAKWYLDHGQREEAINHYGICGGYQEIFDIILSFHTRVSKGTADAFIALIEAAPEAALRDRPILSVVRALYLFNNNRIQEAEEVLMAIREEYETSPALKDREEVLGEVYVLLGLLSVVNQNCKFVEYFKRADQYLPSGSVLLNAQYDIAEGINMVGISSSEPGALRRYQDALFEAAPFAARVMNGCGYGMEYLNAADAAFMTGDIRSAEKYAYETIFRARKKAQHGLELMANFYLVRIAVYKGDCEKIALIFREIKEHSERFRSGECMAIYDIIEGWFHVKIGKPSKVADWIMVEEEMRKLLAPVIIGREYLVRSDCLLAEEKYYELLAFMKQSDELYTERGILYARIQNRITEAIVYHYLGEQQSAMDALKRAYDLSLGNHLVMQFIEYGSKMRGVIQTALQWDGCEIPREWLHNIYTKSSTYAKRLAHVVRDHNAENLRRKRQEISLSKREQEALSCLCQGFTREEIADTLGISPNTVKRLLQSIYGKLGAMNSLDAVRIATMLELM